MIRNTKLHAPPIAQDHVPRPLLFEKLKNYHLKPLVLVSAPAGYGKSQLVSCWLQETNLPFGWISLEKEDNDLRIFLNYFLAAVQKISTDYLVKFADLLKAPKLPSVMYVFKRFGTNRPNI